MKHVAPIWLMALFAAFPAAADPQVTPTRGAAASGDRAVAEAPLDPRWQVRTVTISGLTVWTFKPGHFVRQAPSPSIVAK